MLYYIIVMDVIIVIIMIIITSWRDNESSQEPVAVSE